MNSLKILAFPETELRAVFDLAEELSRVGQDSPYYYELEDGYDIRTIQELLGHRAVKTTVVYTHVLNRGGRGVFSPMDHF
jgi:integrase